MIGERDKPRRLTLPPEEALPRIDAITVNARATWFALLGLLAFVGVTLLGVEDIDFFDASRRTDLPLVGVSVPTLTFFWVAPALTSAVYAYFHFYLMKLWDALAEAPATVKGRRLGDLVHPWLVTDAALWFRRHEGATADRPLRIVSGFTAGALSWGFGWAVLGYAWWRSHTAHLEWMSLWLLALFVFSLWVGASSLHAAWRRVGHGETRVRHHGKWPRRAVLAAAVPLAMVSWMRTEGGIEAALIAWSDWRAPGGESPDEAYVRRRALEIARFSTPWLSELAVETGPSWVFGAYKDVLGESSIAAILAPINLVDAQIVQKPEGWQDFEAAKADFRAEWCKRRERPVSACIEAPETDEGEPDGDVLAARKAARDDWCVKSRIASDRCEAYFVRQEAALLADWKEQRDEYISTLVRPSLSGRDLRGAQLSGAFFPGLSLRGARIEGANLTGARLEGSDLRDARMAEAVFREARMEGANLTQTRMERANLRLARMEGANLYNARMEEADLGLARMQRATLWLTHMKKVVLSDARMEGANLVGARMEGADLIGAWMEGADLSGAWMAEAQLSGAPMARAQFRGARMEEAFLWEARMQEADLRRANMKSAAVAYAFFGRSNARAADFSGVSDMSQEQVNSLFGDRATILPEGLRRTDLMDREPLKNWWDPDPEYEAWLAAGAPPGKPLP